MFLSKVCKPQLYYISQPPVHQQAYSERLQAIAVSYHASLYRFPKSKLYQR
jgi:hypothetical protein